MDVIEAIISRRSIRAFRPQPVPREMLEQVMGAARWAPSWANTQPWEFAIVGGEVLGEIKKALLEKALSGARANPDLPPPQFSEAYNQRRRELGWQLYQALGISREDRNARLDWALYGTRFFEAPNVIIAYIERQLGPWSLLDLGMAIQTILLAAQGYGLGCCVQAATAGYPDELRRALAIPSSKLIVCSIAVGYPDPDHPAIRFRSSRLPLEALVTWHGFD